MVAVTEAVEVMPMLAEEDLMQAVGVTDVVLIVDVVAVAVVAEIIGMLQPAAISTVRQKK